MDILTLKLSAVQVLGLACFGVVMGKWLKKKITVLDRLNIPDSVTGGLVYALAALVCRDRYLNLEFDMVLRDVLMVAFFTTVGMSASLRFLKIGGKQVGIFLMAAVAGLLAQIAWGVSMAETLGLNLLIGLIPGAVSLTGGPATAIAFGKTFEEIGVAGATTIGLASAVFGITIGGLLGGYVGGFLIRRNRLHSNGARASESADLELLAGVEKSDSTFLGNIIALSIAMAGGTLVSAKFQEWGWTLPSYIGAMICAGALRNLDDALGFVKVSQEKMDEIGGIALEIFIVMALLTLRLWELASLALPILAILIGQIVLLIVLCWTLIFRLMGRDYQAGVMAGGYFGFMMGTTANALACMGELTSKYGPAPRAFFVVSIVGAFLIDFINALLITQSINLLR